MTTEQHPPVVDAFLRNGRNLNSPVDANSNAVDDNDATSSASRKPSYVGLSCAVSGYSSFAKYTSPSRKTTPPKQFRVSSEPQMLDIMRQYSSTTASANDNNNCGPVPARGARYERKIVVEKTHAVYNDNNNGLRETSPASDTSSVGSSSSSSATSTGGGTLVQKQIERLYGGRVLSVHARSVPSPDPEADSSSSSPESTTGSRRRCFGGSRSPNCGDNSPLLQLKPLEVPAVFGLLGPEFREQLKNNSCRVTMPAEDSGRKCDRVIPISVERVIPVVRDPEPFDSGLASPSRKAASADQLTLTPVAASRSKEKPALPAKPVSPTASPKSSASNGPTGGLKSPAVVKATAAAAASKVTVVEDDEAEDEAHVARDDDEVDEGYPSCGLRERSLLCPILEEDAESTASGSSLSVVAAKTNQPVIHSLGDENATASAEQVHNGHYFIKALENEIFKFEEQICDFEEDLSTANAIPEDIRDSILAAIGKAKLLMGQKLVQFRGLCDKNISSNPAEDPFVPTSEDLAGFWDMVYIQVEHIHSLFAELVEIRKNGWKRKEESNGTQNKNGTPQKARPKRKTAANGNAKSPAGSKNVPKSEAAKARDEARRKMLEEKKRLMKLKQQQQKPDDELFVPV